MSELFRREALTAASDRGWGQPIALMPSSWRALTIFFTLLSIAVITFLSTATFARKETALGVLNFSKGELRIVSAKGGIVREVYVKEGQQTDEGTPLALVSTEQELAGGDVVDQRILKAINAEQAMLQERLAALNTSAPLERQGMAEKLRGIRAQISSLNDELPVRQQRLEISRAAFAEGRAGQTEGIISGNTARERQYDFLAQEQALGDFRTRIAQLEAQAAEEVLALDKQPSDTAQARASIQQEIVSLEEKRANTNAQNGFVLSSPAKGYVTALQARPGQPTDPSKPLMTIVPDGSVLQAEIYVPSRAIGFVQPGQKVRLLYDAFPHERFGPAFGEIAEISTSVLRPDEVIGAVVAKEPVYRAIVVPAKATVSAYGKEVPLRSGMALTADIVLEDRSFLKLMLDPLRASGDRIFGD